MMKSFDKLHEEKCDANELLLVDRSRLTGPALMSNSLLGLGDC